MYHTFLIKYGEIGLKGSNRHVFEDALAKQIMTALRRISGEFSVRKERGRVYVNCSGDWDEAETVETLGRVFGIVGICPVHEYPAGDYASLEENMLEYVRSEYPDSHATFKVKAKRVDKEFPKTSMEISADLGGAVLEHFPDMKVDVHNPDILFDIEIRDRIYIYSHVIPGPGGMPVGSNGSAMLWFLNSSIKGRCDSGSRRSFCSIYSNIDRLVSWLRDRSEMSRSLRVFCPKKI